MLTFKEGGDMTDNNVYPFMRYQDCSEAIDWLERVFGFERVAVYEGPAGTVAHAEMRAGKGMIMLGSSRVERSIQKPAGIDDVDQGIYIALPDADIDTHYQRAKSAGAVILREIEDTDYGSREYSAIDPEGYWWSFGTYHPAAGTQNGGQS
jgi:uncharacterized glyoxalase superfamily protein PhnB